MCSQTVHIFELFSYHYPNSSGPECFRKKTKKMHDQTVRWQGGRCRGCLGGQMSTYLDNH